jgi:hypothetical protein
MNDITVANSAADLQPSVQNLQESDIRTFKRPTSVIGDSADSLFFVPLGCAIPFPGAWS